MGCYAEAMRSITLFFCSVALLGCGDDSSPADAGTDTGTDMTDGGVDGGTDSGPPPTQTCDADEVETLVGVMGETQSVTVDTSMVTTRPLDLGTQCGNQEAGRPARAVAIQYTVPGTGGVAVEFTTLNDGTDAMFNTLIQVRTGSCAMIPTTEEIFPLTCFDNAAGGTDARSEGVITVEGGSTLYIIVSGFAESPGGFASEGIAQLDITARANSAPTLTMGDGLHFGPDSLLRASGTDPDGDVVSLFTLFVDASGDLVDVNGNGAEDDLFLFNFDEDLEGMTDWSGSALLSGLEISDEAVSAVIQAYDSGGAISPMLTVDFATGTVAGVGEACADADTICTGPLECEADLCVVPPAVMTLCDMATEVAFAENVASVTGSITSGDGLLVGSCAATPGKEVLYQVTVPADGTYDLLASTDVASPSETDTVLYARSSCVEDRSEVACNDDIDLEMMNLRSEIELMDLAADSVVFLGVEQFGGVADGMAAFGLDIRLRPVLPMGADCDMAGVMNRCAGAACAAGVCP